MKTIKMTNQNKLYIAILILIAAVTPVFANSNSLPIHPTGTYGMVVKKGSKMSGEIQIRQISKSRLIIVLGVNVGAPSYNSGTLIDTLTYFNDHCIYKGDSDDPTCQITFKFTKTGVFVSQRQADLNAGCGFGHGVFADGFYKKLSSKKPVLRHPQTDELIK